MPKYLGIDFLSQVNMANIFCRPFLSIWLRLKQMEKLSYVVLGDFFGGNYMYNSIHILPMLLFIYLTIANIASRAVYCPFSEVDRYLFHFRL